MIKENENALAGNKDISCKKDKPLTYLDLINKVYQRLSFNSMNIWRKEENHSGNSKQNRRPLCGCK